MNIDDLFKQIESAAIDFNCEIQKILLNLDFNKLTYLNKIKLENENYNLPFNICGLYFLLHPDQGILYIGKTINLRQRWSILRDDKSNELLTCHHMLERSLEQGGVYLAWKEINREIAGLIEPILIKKLHPKWNTINKARPK